MALKSEKIFELMDVHIKEHGPELVKKAGAVFYFEILKSKGDEPKTWTLDLKNDKGI